MAFVEVHPKHDETLRQQGLTAAADFLRLDGVIVGGHPDRHVQRVAMNGGACFLKKEHRIRWRERLAHWWQGSGLVSKATREGRLLRQLEEAGIGCPTALAHGECAGQAFLLLREETDVVDLRAYLRDNPEQQLALADALGRELARIHGAGFQHRDLYSKHILVGRDDVGWRFCFLDWQRGRRTRRLTWPQRLYDLATLDATLAAELVPVRTRLLCWRTYLAAQAVEPAAPRKLLRGVCRLSAALQRKRRIRELRQPPLSASSQNLIWLDGEALVVTPQFHKRMPQIPAWLALPATNQQGLERSEVPSNDGTSWNLVRRFASQPWRWLTTWWRRPAFPAPEFERAAALIRLERYGVDVPKLLALGHRKLKPWQTYSFLLTEPQANVISLHEYLETALPRRRRETLRRAGQMLRRIHEAGYVYDSREFDDWIVQHTTGVVGLGDLSHIRRRRKAPARLGRQSLRDLARRIWPGLSATDRLRFFLGYHGLERLTKQTRAVALTIASRRQSAPSSRAERRVA